MPLIWTPDVVPQVVVGDTHFQQIRLDVLTRFHAEESPFLGFPWLSLGEQTASRGAWSVDDPDACHKQRLNAMMPRGGDRRNGFCVLQLT
jgi:hypothetical protein